MEIWGKSDIVPPLRNEGYQAGINILEESGDAHYDAIVCYGITAEEASTRRDLILGAISVLSFIKVVK